MTVLSAQGQSIWDLGHLRAVKESLDAVALLEASEAFTDEDSRALKRWFGL